MSKLLGIHKLKQIMSEIANRNLSSARSGRGKGKDKGRCPPIASKNAEVPTLGFKAATAEQVHNACTTKSLTILPPPSSSKATQKKKKFLFPNMDDQGLPLLSPKDCFRRVEFASKMMVMLEKDPGTLDSILFTDEGNFHLAKKADIKNEKEGPSRHVKSKGRKFAESQPLPQIVWCGMTSKHVIGPYFFNTYVTDRTYLKMLHSYLIPQMQSFSSNGSIDKCWFQQDGAPPHRSQLVLPYLTETFESRLISYGCPLAWPPKSQDLTPLDYFFWDYLKEKIASNFKPSELSTRKSFRASLAKQIDAIDEVTLAKAIHELPARLEKCLEANGNRFDMDT